MLAGPDVNQIDPSGATIGSCGVPFGFGIFHSLIVTSRGPGTTTASGLGIARSAWPCKSTSNRHFLSGDRRAVRDHPSDRLRPALVIAMTMHDAVDVVAHRASFHHYLLAVSLRELFEHRRKGRALRGLGLHGKDRQRRDEREPAIAWPTPELSAFRMIPPRFSARNLGPEYTSGPRVRQTKGAGGLASACAGGRARAAVAAPGHWREGLASCSCCVRAACAGRSPGRRRSRRSTTFAPLKAWLEQQNQGQPVGW